MTEPNGIAPGGAGGVNATPPPPPPPTNDPASVAAQIKVDNTTTVGGRAVTDFEGVARDVTALAADDPAKAADVQRAVAGGLTIGDQNRFAQAMDTASAAAKDAEAGRFSVAAAEQESAKGLFAEGGAKAGVEDGTASAAFDLSVGGADIDATGTVGALGNVVGGHANMGTYSAQAQGEGHIAVTGAAAKGQATASMADGEVSAFVGEQNNPYAEAGAKGAMLNAEAKGDALIGSTADRSGVAVSGGAKAAVLSGAVDGEVNIPLPFTDSTIRISAEVGGDLVAAALGGGAHAYHDHETGRTHLGVMGEVAAFLGISADIDVSFGAPYTSRDR